MTLVVADTGPLNYLHLIGRLEILPAFYQAALQRDRDRRSRSV
jgi:hypothetical protein